MAAVDRALNALSPPGLALADATELIPERPGLYAIHGRPPVWEKLGLGLPPDDRPLYLGKSESSLASRDLQTHFGNGRTGSSTIRRSFAALLQRELALAAQPRNPARPERFSSFGLPPDQDARLTQWMRDQLRIAVWVKAGEDALRDTERELLRRLLPPLNLQDVRTPWTVLVKGARARMARSAKASVP